MRRRKSHVLAAILCLSVVGTLLVACTAPAAAPTAAPTKAPAAAPTTAPAAAPTTAPAAAPTKPAAPEATKPAAPAATKLGPLPQLPPTTVQWAAGGVGGGWYALSASVAELIKQEQPNLQINVVPGAGIANHLRVAKGDVQVAFGFPPLAKALMEGVEPFKPEEKSQDITAAIAGFSITYLTFAVADEVAATTFEEFVQKKLPLKIAVDRVGTTDEWSLRLALKHYGVTYDDIKKWGGNVTFTGYADQATNMKDKHVDAVWENIAAPSPTLQDVMTSRKIRVLPLSEPLRKELIEKTSFANQSIPTGRYGNDKPIPSVASITTLMANPKVSEDVIYTITRIVGENADKVRKMQQSAQEFDPATAWKETGAPLHPGAAKYYKEKGYMK